MLYDGPSRSSSRKSRPRRDCPASAARSIATRCAAPATGCGRCGGVRAEHLWQARAAQFRRALARAPQPRFWQRALVWAGRIDRMVKGREAGEPWREFERLLLALMQPRSAAALAS